MLYGTFSSTFSSVHCSDMERKETLLAKLLNLLLTWNNENTLIEWIMYFLGMVLSYLNQSQDHLSHDIFVLELFMFSIVVATGCAAFVDENLGIRNKICWLNRFPEALWLLSKRQNWTFHMPRVRY